MQTGNRAIEYANENVDLLAKRYESIDPQIVHSLLQPYLPALSGRALDIGAGSGRDAAWLAGLGMEVVAVEPANMLRERAQDIHGSENISWMDGALPDLPLGPSFDEAFDLVLISAVMMFVEKHKWREAVHKIKPLIKSGGILVASLLLGSAKPERGILEVTHEDVDEFIGWFGWDVIERAVKPDLLGRAGVNWEYIVLRKADGEGY